MIQLIIGIILAALALTLLRFNTTAVIYSANQSRNRNTLPDFIFGFVTNCILLIGITIIANYVFHSVRIVM